MKNKIIEVSIVSPVYKCDKCVEELVRRIQSVMNTLTDEYEIVFVDDASPDSAWSKIKGLARQHKSIRGIRLSRNYGQHNAIIAGLNESCGKWVVVMDCDLQDRPEEIVSLYNEANLGWDIVLGQRKERKDVYLKRLSSKLFYKVLSYLTQTEQNEAIGNFGIYSRKVVDAICSMGDEVKYLPTMTQWVGFRRTSIRVTHDRRSDGKSSYTIRSLVRLATNVMLGFSDRPLILVVRYGLAISIVSMLFAAATLVRYVFGGITVSGWTSTIISIWFLAGNIVLVLGVISLYISRILEKVKMRPSYIISERTADE